MTAVRLHPAETVGYLLLQQGLWVLLVWGAAAGLLWWPSLVAAAVLVGGCLRAGPGWWRVLAVIAVGIGCALVVDGSLLKLGLVGYAGQDGPLPPLWIILLWAVFAATLALPARHALSHPLVAAVLGAVGGPLAYAGGRWLGAIDATDTGLAVVGVFYALATPVVVLVANRLLPTTEPQP